MKYRFILVFSLTLAIAAVGHAQLHPFDVHDLVAMQRISDPRPSPGGSRAAFVVTTMDLEANKGRKDVWLAAIDGSGASPLTTHHDNDWSPRWRDDESLYFLSSRSGSVQVWRWDFAVAAARRVSDLPLDVVELAIGPRGEALYVGLSVFPDCEDAIPCTVKRLETRAAEKASGLIYDRLFFRHWDTWEDGRRNHIFRIPLEQDGTAGPPVDLMPGVDGDSPTSPWGDDADFAVSPDGRWLVYTAKVVEGSEEAWSTDWNLWAVPTDGSRPARPLTEDNPAWDSSPVFSPDGATLAYLAMARPGYESDRRRVMLMDWATGRTTNLTERWDRSPDSVVWAPDGESLFASAANLGNTSIFRIDSSDGMVSAVTTVHTNTDPRPLADGRLLFARDSLVSPVELFVLPSDGIEAQQITHLNDQRLAGIAFGTYKQFSFPGANSDEVFGYLVYPVGYSPNRTYPLAFLIHGGPQGSFDDHWHYRWNPQVYAGHGYATVMIDFHGSTGYGQDFTDAINGDWGGAPYTDLMKGLDHVLRRHPWIDPDRVAAAGASFGGYMINWIQGRTDRFKALVCHDGNLDEFMAYFDTEELWFPEWEHGGTPWENPDGYTRHSPVNYVQHWQTPELVIHGAFDYRVVDTQGLATFNALQRLGVPSRLLYYPDENHWVLKPLNSIQWHEVVLDWMDTWTAPANVE
jgi:dipeptidyl aminopeptidase/acylaminoacyl peptidase